MPQIRTRRFGTLEIDPEAVLVFPEGLPGFPGQSRFVLVEQPAVAPIVFLQSLSEDGPCFLSVGVAAVDPHYELAIPPEDLRLLGLDEGRQPRIGGEVLCLAILSAAENHPATANLLAPVVIHLASRRAVQAVRADARYSHQHPLGGEDLCS